MVARWRKLAWQDRALLMEAMLLLAIGSLFIAVLPFRMVAALTAWGGRTADPSHDRIRLRRRVGWAVQACASRVPWHAMCLQQSVAAQWMLRRRGVPATLVLGAAIDSKDGLIAHAWVRDGEVTVVGGDNLVKYAELAAFPSAPVRRDVGRSDAR